MADTLRFPPNKRALPDLSRRGFLVSLCAAGAVFGFPKQGAAAMDPAAPGGLPPEAAGASYEPAIWYWIDSKGIVNVNIIRAEMGQHVGTAIARILADELGAAWDDVHITHVDTDPKWGLMVTGGSWSVWQSFPLLSQAGAAGRIALIEEGARLLGVAPSACTARASTVSAGSRSIRARWISTHCSSSSTTCSVASSASASSSSSPSHRGRCWCAPSRPSSSRW